MDFRLIVRSQTRPGDQSALLAPEEMLSRHWESRDFIDAELSKSFVGTTLVLTHHGISPRSLDPRFAGHVSNAAFSSDLSDLIRKRKPHFWVHGHIHRAADYIEGSTRVLCNPKGYLNEMGGNEFRPGLVIETTVAEGEEVEDV
jgi:hypothetical protein